MKVFVVIARTAADFPRTEASLARNYPGAYYKVREGLWFVRSNENTSKEVSDKVGFVLGNEVGTGMVVSVNGYFGLWQPDVWEWLAARPEASNG